jgi:prepilin-type N-terminal cleavage/methylation domain-containing protein
MRTRHGRRAKRAFTLVELLTVIAIIAVLAALLFPVFAAAREQTRQSNTFSNMHSMYEGVRLFDEDEKRFPSTLFPYAETMIPAGVIQPAGCPATRPAVPADVNASSDTSVALNNARGLFAENATCTQLNYGYLYGEQVKDYRSFLCTDNTAIDKSKVTQVYYPLSVFSTPTLVTWVASSPTQIDGDYDIPGPPDGTIYSGQPKLYYTMDSMDIGPMLDAEGNQMVINGQPAYELHYTPDWTHLLGATQDVNGNGQANITQLKYKNPPPDRTVITYVTYHVTTAHSSYVLVLLDSGSAIKLDYKRALQELPLNFTP